MIHGPLVTESKIDSHHPDTYLVTENDKIIVSIRSHLENSGHRNTPEMVVSENLFDGFKILGN